MEMKERLMTLCGALVFLFGWLPMALCAHNPPKKQAISPTRSQQCRIQLSNQHFFSLPIRKRREKRNVVLLVLCGRSN